MSSLRLLTFQARRFAWRSHSRTLDSEPEVEVDEDVEDTVVAFVHAEAGDEGEAERARALRHTLKHLKWLAGKREWRRVVLHSFTHLGAENARPGFARGFLEELGGRLESAGFEVWSTPFGYFCEWDLSVYGESLAKVWKQV